VLEVFEIALFIVGKLTPARERAGDEIFREDDQLGLRGSVLDELFGFVEVFLWGELGDGELDDSDVQVHVFLQIYVGESALAARSPSRIACSTLRGARQSPTRNSRFTLP
jgi:hypothetical protein